MIHLAVCGTEEPVWRNAAVRLRGATVQTYPVTDHAPPETCSAVAFLGPGRPEPVAIERCLRAGKHVLVGSEAPLPGNVLTKLAATAQALGVRFTPVNPDRYLPSRRLIRQQLDAGKLGNPGLVRLHRWEPHEPDRVPPVSETPAPLVRDLDLVLWLLGKPPNLVYALQRALNREGSSGQFLQVHLGFGGNAGGMALLNYTDGLPPGPAYQSLSVIGSAGAAQADDHANMQLLYRGGLPQAVRADESGGQLTMLLQDFADSLDSGSRASGWQSWASVWAVVEALRRSLDTRQAVRLEDG